MTDVRRVEDDSRQRTAGSTYLEGTWALQELQARMAGAWGMRGEWLRPDREAKKSPVRTDGNIMQGFVVCAIQSA